MQDKMHRTDDHAETGLLAEGGSRTAAEEVSRLMQVLLDITRGALERAVTGDPKALREFLQVRGKIVERLENLLKEASTDGDPALRERQFKNTLALKMQSIMMENSRVIQLIRERKKGIVAKIAEAQARRQVLKYTQ